MLDILYSSPRPSVCIGSIYLQVSCSFEHEGRLLSKWRVYSKKVQCFCGFLVYFEGGSVDNKAVTSVSSFINWRVVSTTKEGLRISGMYAVHKCITYAIFSHFLKATLWMIYTRCRLLKSHY